MKVFLLLTFVVVSYAHFVQFEKDDYFSLFKQWKTKFEKVYKNLVSIVCFVLLVLFLNILNSDFRKSIIYIKMIIENFVLYL